jgi:structure-specific recognition protein 1
MLDKELSVKGWNWGAANFNGAVLQFEVGKHDAFEVPLTYVSHCSSAKNEVISVLFYSTRTELEEALFRIRIRIEPRTGMTKQSKV